MRRYRVEVTVQNGMVTIEGFLENPPSRELHVQTYSVDTLDPATRLGLIELGWTPPVNGSVGTKHFIRTIEEGDAQESQETKDKGDAREALQEGAG